MDASYFFKIQGVLHEVLKERIRQHDMWGEQNFPDGTGDIFARAEAIGLKRKCDRAMKDGTVTFKMLLLEEVCEACAELDPVKLRTELIQIAAFSSQWVEAIDRRLASSKGSAKT